MSWRHLHGCSPKAKPIILQQQSVEQLTTTLHTPRVVLLQGFNIPSEGLWFWFEGMVDLFFYIDLVLNFFTAHEVGVLMFWVLGLRGIH